MLIDTHCHLDAGEFDADRDAVATAAYAGGVSAIVIPAVVRANFMTVCMLAQRHTHCAAALGIHPLYVEQSDAADIDYLRRHIETQAPVAIGEIGLDFFVEGYNRERQTWFFTEQLKLAREFDLPVLLHVRRAVDDVLKQLRRYKLHGGIAHAFNGSEQQAHEFIKLGFKLGFGGTMTYPRALKIRALAKNLPLEAIVLETDAPDIAPEWLGHHGRNSPDQLPAIAEVLAHIRGIPLKEISEITTKNALQILPKLARLCT